MKKAIIVFITAIAIFSYSCKHEIPLPQNEVNNPPVIINPIDTIVCFESEILPLFQSSCASSNCHDASTNEEGLRLYTYNNIRQDIVSHQPTQGKLMEAILSHNQNDIMPPPPHSPMSSSQIALIQQWINQGANNTTNCTSPLCDSTAFRYSADIAPIMSTFCNGCHSGSFPSAGIITSTYLGLNATISNGSLLGSIEHVAPYSAMPKNGAQLSICNQVKITKWVQSGALNN